MSEHVLQKLLEKAGITHPGERRANLKEILDVQRQEIERQYQEGKISRDVGLDATRHLMELALAETVNDPEAYRAAIKSGQIDALRQAAGGWDETIAPDAAAEKRRAAFAISLGNRADDMYASGQLAGEQYHSAMNEVDPNSIEQARRHARVNQPIPGDLDEHPRALTDNEAADVGAFAWHRRQGVLEDVPPAEVHEAKPETGSDWSESKLESFFDRRAEGKE